MPVGRSPPTTNPLQFAITYAATSTTSSAITTQACTTTKGLMVVLKGIENTVPTEEIKEALKN